MKKLFPLALLLLLPLGGCLEPPPPPTACIINNSEAKVFKTINSPSATTTLKEGTKVKIVGTARAGRKKYWKIVLPKGWGNNQQAYTRTANCTPTYQ